MKTKTNEIIAIKVSEMTKILNIKLLHARCLCKTLKQFNGKHAEYEIDKDNDVATFLVLTDSGLGIKYEIPSFTTNIKVNTYNAWVYENDVLVREIKMTPDDYDSREYDIDGKLIFHITNDTDTLSAYIWGNDGIISRRITFMSGKLHHTAKYIYDEKTDTYAVNIYGYDDRLIRVKENIPAEKFWRKDI